MKTTRRSLLAVVGLLLLKPLAALAAWNQEAFGAKSAADALKSLGAPAAAPSKDIVIEAPQIAENGAVVPIEISSNVPGTTSIAVIIEKNPFPLAGKIRSGGSGVWGQVPMPPQALTPQEASRIAEWLAAGAAR